MESRRTTSGPGVSRKSGGDVGSFRPDARGTYIKDTVGILLRAFHTTKESRSERQPHITHSGTVVTWDGRLDNRAELIRQLRNVLSIGSTDIAIVAAAYEEWGKDCFGKLIGDWALSIWDANTRSLILAKDFIGTRHLYYLVERNQVTWSTILDPLVLLTAKTFALCEEYIAGWFSYFPATHLTPYVGIHSVPPSSAVLIRSEMHTVSKYWDFDPNKQIRYLTDNEYEEHFRAVFAKAVQRRLRSDSPILAELSGGMDSSSIVCMADTIIAGGTAETPRLDTVSYYDDSEPNWNERPYFTKVEEKRGRTGYHIDFSSIDNFRFPSDNERFAATPDPDAVLSDADKKFAFCLASNGNCVVLSGIGGDEVAGGVPTPMPELSDLLARMRFMALARQLRLWALNKRKPWFHLLLETARRFLPLALVDCSREKRPAPWLDPNFARRFRAALIGYERRLRLFGPLPSVQENLSTLEVLRRQLCSSALSSEPPYEKRYPYLDRDLVEFLFAIPREQFVRPGQRRSLTRRALVGIVPDELLNRKRKAYVARAPVAALSKERATLVELSQHMVSSSLGIIDPKMFSEALQKARRGERIPIVLLARTLGIEYWLKGFQRSKVSNCVMV